MTGTVEFHVPVKGVDATAPDELATLGQVGSGGFVPDPSGEPDDRWLKTSSGALIYTGAPTGVTYGTPAIALGTAAAAGSIAEAIRRDSTIVAFDATVPVTQAFGDSAATGSAAVAARRDHKHAMMADPFTGAAAGGDLAGTYPNPTIGTGKVTSTMILDGTIASGDLSAALITALTGGVAWTVVAKASDTSRQGTTTMTADPELVFTPASGGLYEWAIFASYLMGAGSGSPHIKVGFGEDNVSRGQGSVLWYLTTGAAPTAITVYDCAPSVVAGIGLNAVTTARPLVFRGQYVGNGVSAGLWWAQSSSVSRDTTVKTGSILCYRRII